MTKISLAQLSLLDVPPDDKMDRFTRLIAEVIGVPVALISIIDSDKNRQFFVSSYGLAEPWASQQQTPLTHSFCQHVVTNGLPLSIKDSRIEPLFQENLAISDLNVISYFGVPIAMPDGSNVGALCAIDHQPREWTHKNLLLLNDLADAISDLIALRVALYESEQSRLSGQRLGRILENSGQGSFTFDPSNYTFMNVNKIARESLGYTLKELKKLTPADLKPDQSIEDFKHFVKPLKDGVISKLDYNTLHKRKDGSTYPISVRLEYHSDVTGSAFVAFSHDITERLAMEHALKEETENFAAFFHNAPEPMTISDLDTTILQANYAYAKIFGLSVDDVIGMKFISLIPEFYHNEFSRDLVKSTPENPLISSLQEQEIDGKTLIFDWMNITHFVDGIPTKIFSIANDVTELHDSKLVAMASQQKMAKFHACMDPFYCRIDCRWRWIDCRFFTWWR